MTIAAYPKGFRLKPNFKSYVKSYRLFNSSKHITLPGNTKKNKKIKDKYIILGMMI